MDLPFYYLRDDAVQDVGDAVILWRGRDGGAGRLRTYSVTEGWPLSLWSSGPLDLPLSPCSHWAELG